MLLLVPMLPFAGFLVNASLGRRLGKAAAAVVACGAAIASFVLACASVAALVARPVGSRAIVQHVFTWFVSGDLAVGFALRLDPLSALMILVITGIGALIHVYSTAYMIEESDSEYARYFSYLNLFVAFMLVLVLGSNLVVMFVGWEGVGLCSYLLIGFWYRKPSACDAGKKAFIVNRIGDWGLVLGILLAFVRFGTVDFQEMARLASAVSPETSFGAVSLITLLLLVGAIGKSAQIPLHVWLPDAMEGPTPVSALIHAATMVTAGVYLIGRNAVLFGHAPQTLAIVATVGAMTALMAGTVGLVQNDIKRVLAYSTISQLGYMFLAMGVGAYAAGIFHLYTHAFFKALLFLGAGAVIHALSGEQDLRRMGGLRKTLPVTYWTFLVGGLALSGVPGLAGFFSKDEILYRTYAGGHRLLWAVGLLTSLLTALYVFRLVFLVFHGERVQAPAEARSRLHDALPAMSLALVVLAAGSVVAGYVGLPAALGGSSRLQQFLAPSFTTGAEGAAPVTPDREGAGDAAGGLERRLMLVSASVAFVGIGLAVWFFVARRDAADEVAGRFAGVRRLLMNQYYVDEIYDAGIAQPIRIVSEEGLWKGVDCGVIDATVNGVGVAVGGGSVWMRLVQTGSVRLYAAALFLGVVLTLGYLLW